MTVGKVFADISMSLDGYVAGPNDGVGNGLGDGGEQLHEWAYELESWRRPHGMEGGERNADADLLEKVFARSGAILVGRRMFDNAEGWGDNPPFKMPVFVLTHRAQDTLEKGETTFTFVTGGVESAVEQAKAAANGKDVSVGGGAATIQQCLRAGFLDEMCVHIAPILLGGGVRLFENLDPSRVTLEQSRVVESPRVAHLFFRVGTGAG